MRVGLASVHPLGRRLFSLLPMAYNGCMLRTLLVVPLILLLAGCAALVPGPNAKPLPKWQPLADVARFGDWTVDDATCLISASSAEVKAESSGKLNDGMMAVKISMLMPLVRPPLVQMSGLPVALPLDGSSWTFRTYLAYDAQTVAHMMDPGTFLIVEYQPLNTIESRQAHFDTRGLLQAAVHVGKVCGK